MWVCEAECGDMGLYMSSLCWSYAHVYNHVSYFNCCLWVCRGWSSCCHCTWGGQPEQKTWDGICNEEGQQQVMTSNLLLTFFFTKMSLTLQGCSYLGYRKNVKAKLNMWLTCGLTNMFMRLVAGVYCARSIHVLWLIVVGHGIRCMWCYMDFLCLVTRTRSITNR